MARLKRLPYVAQVLFLAVIYVITGKLGLALVPVSGFATVAWPPTGLSLAALLIFGPRLWPGIALGALCVNLSAGASPVAAVGIAVGNSTEALVGAFLLRRYFNFHLSLDRIKDAIALVVVGVFLSSPISATIGTLSLWFGGLVARSAFASTWLAWWVGDGLSDVLVTSFLLVWATPAAGLKTRQGSIGEGIGLFLSLVVICEVVFSSIYEAQPGKYPMAFLTFPFLIWAGLRFGQRGAVTASMVITTYAIWGTFRNLSAHPPATILAHLYFIQSYMAATSITALILASVIAERNTAQQSLNASYYQLERKVAERTAALQASEERFRLLVEGVKEYSIHMLDEWGNVISWNEGAKQNLGYDSKDIIGQHISKFYPDEDVTLGKPARVLALALRKGRFEDVSWLLRKDGSRFLGRVTITPLKRWHGSHAGYSIITRDITEEKQIEDQLQKQLSVLTAITETTSEPIFIKDLAGRYEMINSVMSRLFGKPMEEIIGRDDTQLFPAEIAKQLRDGDRLTIDSGQSRLFEDTLDFQGRKYIFSVNKTPYRDRQGKIVGVIGITRDITARKKNEALVAGQRSVFKMLAEEAPIAEVFATLLQVIEAQSPRMLGSILLLDSEGKHLRHAAAPSLPEFFNKAIDGVEIGPAVGACGTSAYLRKTVIVRDILSDPLWRDYRELPAKYGLRSCWSSPVFSKNGELLATFAMYSREVRGPTSFEMQLTKDAADIVSVIIEHARTRDSLQKSISLLNATIESTADGICVVGRNGKIARFNRRFVDVCRLPRVVLESKEDNRILDVIMEQMKDPELLLEKCGNLGEAPELEGHDFIEFKDGRLFERYSLPQRLNHEIVGRVWSFRDITERRARDDEKAEFLKREQSARASAEAATRMRDELVAMVSHDLKNPLSGILAGIYLIQKSNWVNEHGKRPLAMIAHSGERMSRLIQDLLDSHRIESGCFDVQSGLDLRDVLPLVREAVEAQGILCTTRKVHFELDLPDIVPKLMLNVERIQQVFQNLLGNAIKFTREGGLICVKVESVGTDVLFSVKDSCFGIDASLLPHLFERFYQARKTAASGTGLGLSIAKGIVEAHGGKIWVVSSPGKGCTFFFTLPMVGAKSSENAA